MAVRVRSRPLVFTSIPPHSEGVAFDPSDAASVSQRAIQSWIAAGFLPVSVNTASEVARVPRFEPALRACGVELCVYTPPAPVHDSGPLVPLHAFLRVAAARAGADSFAITNADIRFCETARPLAHQVQSLRPTEFLLAQRTDVTPGIDGVTRTSVFVHGFDFVALRGAQVAHILPLLSPALLLGRPWWDHVLPLALMTCGAATRLLPPAWFQHTIHDNRWNVRQYRDIGRTSVTHFGRVLAETAGYPGGHVWQSAVAPETVLAEAPPAVARVVFRVALSPWAPPSLATFVLARVAALQMRLLAQTARSGPLMPAHG